MILNISSSHNLTNTLSNNGFNIRSGYESIKRSNLYNTEENEVKVDFSTKLNTQVTKLLAKESIPALLNKIRPDSKVHLIDGEKVGSLI